MGKTEEGLEICECEQSVLTDLACPERMELLSIIPSLQTPTQRKAAVQGATLTGGVCLFISGKKKNTGGLF